MGTFQNSIDRQSVQFMAKYHWIEQGNWAVRWQLGGVTGYRDYPVAPVVLPELCWQWLCGMVIPAVDQGSSTAVGMYLRIPVK
jgi:hypothetical protein